MLVTGRSALGAPELHRRDRLEARRQEGAQGPGVARGAGGDDDLALRQERQSVPDEVGADVVLAGVGLDTHLGQPTQPRREGHEGVVVRGGIPEGRDGAAHRRGVLGTGVVAQVAAGHEGRLAAGAACDEHDVEGVDPAAPGEPGDEARVAGAPEAVRAERDEGAVGDVVVDGEVGTAGEGDHALDAGTPRLDALPPTVHGGEVAARGLAEDFRDGVHAIHPTGRVPLAPVGVHLLAPAHRPGG